MDETEIKRQRLRATKTKRKQLVKAVIEETFPPLVTLFGDAALSTAAWSDLVDQAIEIAFNGTTRRLQNVPITPYQTGYRQANKIRVLGGKDNTIFAKIEGTNLYHMVRIMDSRGFSVNNKYDVVVTKSEKEQLESANGECFELRIYRRA